jgi:hypothetical protein
LKRGVASFQPFSTDPRIVSRDAIESLLILLRRFPYRSGRRNRRHNRFSARFFAFVGSIETSLSGRPRHVKNMNRQVAGLGQEHQIPAHKRESSSVAELHGFAFSACRWHRETDGRANRVPGCLALAASERAVRGAADSARVHRTLRCMPAMAAGVTDRLWSVEELIGATS